MTVLSQLKRDLQDAAGHVLVETTERPPRRSRRLWLMGTVSLAVSLAVIAVVALGSRTSGPSQLGSNAATGTVGGRLTRVPAISPSMSVDQAAIAAAIHTVTDRDPACSQFATSRRPGFDYGTPAPALLRAVPALVSRSSRLPSRLRHLPSLLGAGGLYVHYVREARVLGGSEYWLLPVAHDGHIELSSAGARTCSQQEDSSLARDVRRLPPLQQRATLLVGRKRFDEINDLLQIASQHDGLLLWSFPVRGYGGSGGGGLDSAQIEASGLLTYSADRSTVRTIVGVVPGDVARVTLIFGSRRLGSNIGAMVVNDVFIIRLPAGTGELARMVWQAPSGRTIRTVNETSSGA